MSRATVVAGHAYPHDPTEGTERGRPRARCDGIPEWWDLDRIYADLDAILEAVEDCQRCPLLSLCTTYSKGLLRNGYKIQAVVQAGLVWQADNGPKLPDDIELELIRRRLLGSKRRFLK